MIRHLEDVAATWRITRLVTEDEIAAPLRRWVGRRWPDSKASYLVNCPYCVSVWAGLAVSSGLIPRLVVRGLALSAGALSIRWTAEVSEAAVQRRDR